MKKIILIGLALLLSIFLLGSLVAVLYITRTTERMDRLILLHQVEILREDLIIHLQQVQSSILHKKIRGGGDADNLVSRVQEMDKVMDSCLGCHHTPELSQGLVGMRDMANDYKIAISRLITVSANPARIAELERRVQDLGQELITMTQGMAFTANVRLQQKTQETMTSVREVRTVLYSTLFIGFLLAVGTAWVLARSLDRRLEKLLVATRRISQGELQHRVAINDSKGSEFRELGEAFNAMTQNLQQSQRQLVQSAKLAAIGELAANIAYEVNNPLTGVLGYTGLLIKSEDIPTEKKEQLRTIERETLRAREILKNLLDFARRKPPRLERAAICTVIEDTLDLVKGKARVTNVKINLDCPARLPSVPLDIDEIKQVFINIVHNAFFAMRAGGTLTIKSRQVSSSSGKPFIAVEFFDTGVGIPEAQIDKIFDPFFTTRLEGEGAGLGLSISYMIVQNHGGTIEVESKVGEGSTFRVLLPV